MVGALLALGTTMLAVAFLIVMLEDGASKIGPTCQGCSIAWSLALPVLTLVGGVAVFFALLRGPVGRAIGRMLESQDPRDVLDEERFGQLEDRLAESDLDRQQVAELEARIDFAERLLSRRTDGENLPLHRTPV
jgi:hypothetical protein